MGWFGNKGQKQDDTAPAPSQTTSSEDSQQGSTAAEPAETREHTAEGVKSEEPEPMPAVFEFGGLVSAPAIRMAGVCTSDDSDQITACLWQVSKAPKKESSQKYHIEF